MNLYRKSRPYIAVLAACISASGAHAALITFHSPVIVKSPVITLGQIADVIDADSETVARLNNVTLGPGPSDGRDKRFDFENVRARLRAVGIDLSTIEFSGPTSVTTTTDANLARTQYAPRPTSPPTGKHSQAPTASREQFGPSTADTRLAEQIVVDTVRIYLGARAPAIGEVDFTPMFNSEDVVRILAIGRRGLDVRGGTAPWTGRQTFQFSAAGSTQSTSEISVTGRVVQRPFVLAVKHSVPRGSIITKDDLVWEQSREDGISEPGLVIGYETTRPLTAGSIVAADFLQAAPLVRTNNVVTVTVKMPGLEVKRLMRARSDGKLGETVTLMSLEGREQIAGRVVGFQEVVAVTDVSADSESGKSSRPGVIIRREANSISR
ncbi:flagellar basal body P-ring formation chaperone FlgA [Stratiformator vulcanicus]|nr:flagellar basal body P-ring formation chaperone FlgA [Stratiformator vulcanicus]